MKNTITIKNIFIQLKADLIGKDSHRGITLTYAWMANQFGHISLGFIPSFLVCYLTKWNAVTSAIIVSFFWLGFEILNFLVPLMYKKSKYAFKPKWLNITFDTFTDICFFALGAFLFSLVFTKNVNKTVIIILSLLGFYLIFASRYWFLTKMYQLNAKYPFQFRLSQWNLKISPQNINIIKTYKKSQKKEGNHLLIYGDFGSGKTSLGVGILNELSIKNNSCLYKNGIKMFNAFFDEHQLGKDEIWNWRTADFLLIDDINPSKPIQEELITPKKMLSFIDMYQPIHKNNRNTIKEKNIIWILGSKIKSSHSNDSWKDLLLEIGIAENKISTINLSDSSGL
ncbi:hypothetical protein [Polaribacter sp. R77954]|uniref:hypothetical protein n=1 Tax=Polaribacter sp. R77954 TaxID=3093870 RepID=UPI0037CAA03D